MTGTTVFTLLGKIAIDGADETKKDLNDVADSGQNAESKMTSSFKKIGGAIAAYLTIDAVKNFGTAVVNAAAEIAAEEAAFTQIMGKYSDEAAKKVEKIADATGIVDSRLTPYMTSMTAKFKGLGFDVDDATDLASTGLNIAADAAAFWDKSLDDSMGSLNSFVNGNYEGGEAIGLFANETTLAAWAGENLGFEWDKLTEKEKQFARLEFAKAMQEASGAAGQAAKESDAYANVQGNLSEKWRQFKSEVGEPLLQNVVIPAMKALGDFISNTLSPAFENLKTTIKELGDFYNEHKTLIDTIIVVIGLLVAGIVAYNTTVTISQTITKLLAAETGFLATAMQLMTGKITLATAAQKAMAVAQKALNVVMNANPIGLVIAAITLLVGAFIYLWNNCEGFREFWIKLWEKIKSAFNIAVDGVKKGIENVKNFFSNLKDNVTSKINSLKDGVTNTFNKIKTAITSPIEKARDVVKGVIDKIKGFFSFSVSLPKIKLPHFSIKPSGWQLGDLLKGSIPKLGIDWYAKAVKAPMLLDSPTAFGISNSGNIRVGGEAGSEIVGGTSTIMGMISDAVSSNNGGMEDKLDRLITLLTNYLPALSNQQVVLSTGELVGAMVSPMDRALGELADKRRRGR
jgi:hypothetical protein